MVNPMTDATTEQARRTTTSARAALGVHVRLLGALGALLGLLLVVPRAFADEELHATLREFNRTGQYTLYVSTVQQKDARIYHSKRAGAFLVLDSDYKKPWLILPRTKKIATVDADKVVNATDKSADLTAKAEPEELGGFTMEGRDILVNLEGLVARLRPGAHAHGALSGEELLLHTPDYERGVEDYRPNQGDVKKLVECATPTEVTIFFGSWCPTCSRLIPRILRVEKEIEGSKINITYYGLPKGEGVRNDPEARKYGVTRVPTGVLFVDGRAVGTINSRALNRPETALCASLSRIDR